MKEAHWIIDQFIQQGITQFCIAPGSRSTPLVIAIAEHRQAQSIVHYDERGLGFYALGYAKGANSPAVIVATSGSALGNLLPSVMEAYHSKVPLILLTADRPPELRDCGANQTCNQVNLFSHFLRWQADLPPECSESYFRSIAAQAVFQARYNTPGPVQLNCQFREPFSHTCERSKGTPFSFSTASQIPKPFHTHAARGVILLGKTPDTPLPVLNLAKRLQWPVFADILSQARLYPTEEQIRHFDWMFSTHCAHPPDFVLHFGERLTSKRILNLPVTLHVSPYSSLQDPMRTLSGRIQCDISSFCEHFHAHTDPSWLSIWQQLDREIEVQLQAQFISSSSFTEAHAMRTLAKNIPQHSALFVGNSMPIRNADLFFFPESCRGFFANRGLSGIDGNIATAAGLSDGLNVPVIAFLGDQTCLHDLNSVALLKKTKHPVTLIISNNGGGGIFSYLPIAKWSQFETFVAASHDWHFREIAKMFSIPYSSFEQISFTESSVVELIHSREGNHQFHQTLLQSCMTQQV